MNLLSSFSLQKISLSLLILAICFPIMLYSSYLLIVALLIGLFVMTKQKRWNYCKISPTQILFLIIIIFEMSYSLKNLDKRLSVYLPLGIFPILLSSLDISKRNIISIWKAFVWFLFVAFIFSFLLAFSKSNDEITTFIFFIELSESIDFHHIFLSMYCLTGVCLSYLILSEKQFSAKNDLYVYGSMTVFFALMIFFLNARLGVLYLVGWIFYLLLVKSKDFRKYQTFYILATIILIIGAIYSYSDPDIKERFESITTDPRVVIIESSIKVIKESPLKGYGINEGLSKLHHVLHENGIPFNFNCHNQFLQYQLYYGIIGTLVFLFVIYNFIYIAIKEKHIALLFFIGMFFLFCGVDSILERQRGVVLFSFFYNLYYFHHTKLKNVQIKK